jgi:hypothetical protein
VAAGAPDDFDAVLRFLRGLALPCAPPIGIGSFDLLFANEHEVVVWYSPAREEHTAGEISIPCARLAAAWAALRAGEALDEETLVRLGEGVAGGRWLLAVLAQLPGMQVRAEPLRLCWSAVPLSGTLVPPEAAEAIEGTGTRARRSRGGRRRRRAPGEP